MIIEILVIMVTRIEVVIIIIEEVIIIIVGGIILEEVLIIEAEDIKTLDFKKTLQHLAYKRYTNT